MKTLESFTRFNTTPYANIPAVQNISVDLTWINLLKGLAIIGVILDNWTGYIQFAKTPEVLFFWGKVFALAVGPFVQVFFILSGFGLTLAYYKQGPQNWSWKKWAWRRVNKVIIPYEIIIIFSFMLGLLGTYLYESINLQFSLTDFLVHVTFTQNFYPQSHVWNSPLWFMPIIVGLYISFPFLLKVLTKFGPGTLLIISLVITYLTLGIAVLTGFYRGHGTDLFTFWLFQFALGMVLAHTRETRPEKLLVLVGPPSFLIGAGLLACSWALRTYIPLGKVFNDSLTSIGIFLLLLNIVWAVRPQKSRIGTLLVALAIPSYFMYLIHYPIMRFLIGPPLNSVPMNPIFVITLGLVFVGIIFYLAKLFSVPINKLLT